MQAGGGVVRGAWSGGEWWSVREAAEGLAGGFEAAAGEGEAERRVLAVEAGGRGWRVALAGVRRRRAGGGFEAMAEVVEALGAAADGVVQTDSGLSGGERGEALAGEHELVADGAADAGVEGLRCALRCGAGRR